MVLLDRKSLKKCVRFEFKSSALHKTQMRILKSIPTLNNYRFFRDTPSFYCGFKIAHVAARNCITFPIGSLYVGGLGACFIQEAYLRPKKTTITEPVRRCFTISFPVTESRKSPSFQSSKKSPETLTIFC